MMNDKDFGCEKGGLANAKSPNQLPKFTRTQG